MARDFKALIRLHQWRVDEKKRALGLLLGEVAGLEDQASTLETDIKNEQIFAAGTHDGVEFYYGTYAQAAVHRRHRLSEAVSEVESKIVTAQDEMREEFRDLKSYEFSQAARDEREAKEQNRHEQAFLDELGMNEYRRRIKK